MLNGKAMIVQIKSKRDRNNRKAMIILLTVGLIKKTLY